MYRCLECGHLFEDGEDKRIEETLGYCGSEPAVHIYYVCPLCNGNFETVEPCPICGGHNHSSEEKYCDECKTNTKELFEKLMSENFSEEERNLLNDLYEGERI